MSNNVKVFLSFLREKSTSKKYLDDMILRSKEWHSNKISKESFSELSYSVILLTILVFTDKCF